MDAPTAGGETPGRSPPPRRSFSPTAGAKRTIGGRSRCSCARPSAWWCWRSGTEKIPLTAIGAVRCVNAGVWVRTSNSVRRWKTNWPYFGTVTVSYEAAAKLAAKVGIGVEDSTIRALVQRLGAKAEAQTQIRLGTAPVEKQPQRGATPLAVLLLDGFQVRFRGPGWGRQRTAQPRVEWHEEKLGVFYRQEQAGGKERGELLEKVVVGWVGESLESSRRLHWEALRGGLGRARDVLALADGAPWIWNTVGDRWPQAHQLLDFYHASQHLWNLGHAPGMGGSAVASVASRAGTGGVAGVGGVAAPARRRRESDPAGTKLFCRPSRAPALPNAGAPRLADRQRRRGIGVSVPQRPVQ